MSRKPSLVSRLEKFLIEVNRKYGVGRMMHLTSLEELALSRGYTHKEFWDALNIINDNPRVVRTHDNFFCYLALSDAEVQKIYDDREWFNNLKGK